MSAFERVAAEAVLLAGGGRAILLQIAHPVVGYGVAAHSDFANRPLDRFTNTVTYTYTSVFGTPAERAEVVRRVNRAHGPVHSPRHLAASAPTQPEYDAFDHDAQLWVAATLYQTAATVYEKVFGRLSEAEAREVYEGFAVLGTALQVPDAAWPADLAAFDSYWQNSLSALEVTDDARRVAHDLLHPRVAPPWLQAAMPLVRLLSAGLLPPELRRAFVLPWSTHHQRAFDAVFTAAAAIYPRLPLRLRHLPRDHYLRALRSSMRTPA